MLTRHNATIPRTLVAETVGAMTFLAALLAIAVEVQWLLAMEPGSAAAIGVCVAAGAVALAAPASTVQVGSRIAGLAAITIAFPASVFALIPEGGGDVDRIAGRTASATSIAVSESAFERADAVVLVSSSHVAQSAPAAALAARLRAPILITAPGSLSRPVTSEIQRLEAARAYLVGDGPSAHVAGLLENLGLEVERIGGDRLATGAAVATRLNSARVLLVVGDPVAEVSDPGAWAAVARAGARGQPVLFSGSDALTFATAGTLLEVAPTSLELVTTAGTSASAVLADLRAVMPDTEVETTVVDRRPDSGEPLWLAAPDAPADLLVASAAAAHRGALSVADPTDPDAIPRLRRALDGDEPHRFVAVGGTAALPDQFLDRIAP